MANDPVAVIVDFQDVQVHITDFTILQVVPEHNLHLIFELGFIAL